MQIPSLKKKEEDTAARETNAPCAVALPLLVNAAWAGNPMPPTMWRWPRLLATAALVVAAGENSAGLPSPVESRFPSFLPSAWLDLCLVVSPILVLVKKSVFLCVDKYPRTTYEYENHVHICRASSYSKVDAVEQRLIQE